MRQGLLGVKPGGHDLGGTEIRIVTARVECIGRCSCGDRHLPAAGHGTGQHQKMVSDGPGRIGAVGIVSREPLPGRGQVGHGRFQRAAYTGQSLTVSFQIGHCRLHVDNQRGQRCALIAQDLPTDQVIGLDPGRTFVNRRDARIAVMLGGAGFLDITHATVNLNTQRSQPAGIARYTSP